MNTLTKYEQAEKIKEFWLNVDYYRKQVGLRWTDLVGGNTSLAKKGTRNVSLTTMYDIARRLEVPVDVLLQEDEFTLDMAYNVLETNLKLNKGDLEEIIRKNKMADRFCRKWSE